MKIVSILILSIFLSYNSVTAQDITNKLGGTSADETYDVTDSADNILFRVQSDGNVGIGTTNPDEKLHVAGTIKAQGLIMSTGAENGKVLTTDADGVGTWQEPGFGARVTIDFMTPYTASTDGFIIIFSEVIAGGVCEESGGWNIHVGDTDYSWFAKSLGESNTSVIPVAKGTNWSVSARPCVGIKGSW